MRHVATLSASGHRFFISSGPEIKLATNIAHSDVAKRCKCTVLVSSNIQQEVCDGHEHAQCVLSAIHSTINVEQKCTKMQKRYECSENMQNMQRMP